MNQLNEYRQFVDQLTSQPSKDLDSLISRMRELSNDGCNIARLMTASDGLASESGELKEIVKKMLYQGKPYNEDNSFHMKRELGDIIFYWINGCIALNIDPLEVINENICKLESRYPGGKFTITNSEIRKQGDL